MTPYEQEMEDLALRLIRLNRFDSAMPTTPTQPDQSEDET